MEQFSIMLNTAVTVKTVNIPKYEKGLAISGTTATLKGTPVANANVTIYTTNAHGENLVKLSKVSSNPTGNQFSINSQTITVPASITGSLNVYYFVAKEAEVLSATASSGGIHKAYANCLLQSISNGRLYAGNILLNNCQIAPSISLGGSNSAEVPESSNLTLDLLTLNNLPPYEIIAHEIDSADEI